MAILSDHIFAQGIVGAMAWQFDGKCLRIVWFRWSQEIDNDVRRGDSFKSRSFETYVEAKRKGAAKSRLHRARANL